MFMNWGDKLSLKYTVHTRTVHLKKKEKRRKMIVEKAVAWLLKHLLYCVVEK